VMERAKTVLVGDAHQLSAVKARGGMFEQLCAEAVVGLFSGVGGARTRDQRIRDWRCAGPPVTPQSC
jgi:hypothetical protein